jgi:hypothetical protein
MIILSRQLRKMLQLSGKNSLSCRGRLGSSHVVPGSRPQDGRIFCVCQVCAGQFLLQEVGGDDGDAENRRATQQMHMMFGNVIKLQKTLQQRRADPRMLFARFARNPSVAAALPEPLHSSWRGMGQDFLLLHKSSSTFTQTPKKWHRFAMLMNSYVFAWEPEDA